MSPATELSGFLAGFVAAEGCFTSADADTRFTFQVGLGARDHEMCELLQAVLGVGHLARWPRRAEHYDDEVQYFVGSLHDLIGVIVPFMDEHLPESYKRQQYLDWRARLFEYWDTAAKRPRVRNTSPDKS